MTLLELKNLISSNYPDNNTGLITPLKERQVLNALADFVVSSQGEVDTGLFVYDENNSYSIDEVVVFQNQWYISTINANLGNTPGTGMQWDEVGAQNNVISIYEPGIFLGLLHLVLRNNQLYVLDRNVVGNDPFNSTDFVAELALDIWVPVLEGSGGGGTSLSPDIVAALEAATSPSGLNAFITQQDLDNLDLPSGARVLSVDLIITSTTAGTVTTEWIDNDGDTNSLTDAPLTFIGAPDAGEFRWDNVLGKDDGTVEVQTGTASVEGSLQIPTAPADSIILRSVLWNEEGEAQVTNPPGNQNNQSAWSNIRFLTAGGPNTTNKFAKIWEGNLSRDGNYAIHLAYNDPKNAVNFNGPGAGRLKVSWTCSTARDIISTTVKILTDADSVAGEFRLVQISGNKAALYHKGSHYWSRIDFRVVFQSSAVRLQDFVNNGAYGSAPSAVGTWDSVVNGGSPEYQPAFNRSNNTVLFDKDYVIGSPTAPRSGNILFDLTGAKIGANTKMYHQDASAFTFGDNLKRVDTFEITEISDTDINLFLFEYGEDSADLDSPYVLVSLLPIVTITPAS